MRKAKPPELRPPLGSVDGSWHWVERLVPPGYWNLDKVQWTEGFWHPRGGGAFPAARAHEIGWQYIKPALTPTGDDLLFSLWQFLPSARTAPPLGATTTNTGAT